MEHTSAFWFLLILVAAWPLVVVALFAVQRRYPAGVPVAYRWMLWGALAVFYVGSAGFFFVTAAIVRGFIFLAAGIASAAYALEQRRRPSVNKRS